MPVTPEIILHKADFNPKVRTYIFFIVLFYLVVSFIGLLIVPFWIFGLGQWLSNKFYHTLKCELTNKNLRFSKGIILHMEKTIPLENIQDLSFIGGPILRSFGLTMIKLETAGGGGGAHHHNMMSMIGVIDAESFKTQILDQREKLIKEKYSHSGSNTNATSENELMIDIKNELIKINTTLANWNKPTQ